MSPRTVRLTVTAATALALAAVAVTAPPATAAPPATGAPSARPADPGAVVSVAAARAAASKAVTARPALVKAGPGQDFRVRSSLREAGGATHVRLDRTYRGLPVLGGDVVVHVAPSGVTNGAESTLRAPLTLGTSPTVSAATARATSLRRAAALVRYRGTPTAGDPATVVYAVRGTPRLALETVVAGVRTDQTPSELHVVVDAATGRAIDAWDGVRTGTGHGYHDGDVPLTTTRSGSTYQLKDATRGNTYTTDMKNRTSGNGTLFTDADDDWGNGLLTQAQTAAVDAQFGTATTWDYFRTAHGRTGIRGDGAGAFNRVHYGRNYNNAFWQDSCFCMTYGDGDGSSFVALTSLDVAGHEQTHGVTAATAGLVYSGESGGLNESTSDVFGTLVEFFARNAKDAPDYLVGEKVRPSGTPLRYMNQPSRDGRSADCWSSSVGSLDVHLSSGVGNHAFYLMAVGSSGSGYGASPTCNGSTVTGMGNDAAGAVWYRALTTYMTSGTNYVGARAAMLRAATDLYGSGSSQYATTAAAWSAVGVG